jgi:antitoxin HicB
MIAYPITLSHDDNGTLLVTSPDFPELTSFGDSIDDALRRARWALLEAVAARIHDGEPIPEPSSGKYVVRLPMQRAETRGKRQ